MKIWYSIFNISIYSGNDPAFYQNDNFDWTEIIEKNWFEIKCELDDHLLSNPQFNPNDKKQTVNNHGWWKTMPLMT